MVGSDAIGLTAALTAADAVARVDVLEKARYLCGTAAVSGGMFWVPCNRGTAELGRTDSRYDALRYLRAVTAGRTADDVLAAIVDRGPDMLEFLERRAGLVMVPMDNFPGYHPEWDGAHPGGRSLDPELYDIGRMGALAESLRPPRPAAAVHDALGRPVTVGQFGGGYLDRLERRAGVWRISARVVVHDRSPREIEGPEWGGLDAFVSGAQTPYDPGDGLFA